jgi:predicted permease
MQTTWLESGWLDVRYACRSLKSSRACAAWVIGSLAVGMAATLAALAVLNAFLLLPFPEVTDQQRLVRVSLVRNCGRPDCWARLSAPGDYERVRDGLTGVQGLAAYTAGDLAVGLPDARAMRSVFASANYFDVLGVRPALGRLFEPADAIARAGVAVLAHSAWTREFDADPAVIGQSMRVADAFVEIIGVAPPLFVGIERPRPAGPRRMGVGRAPDVWLPLWLADRAGGAGAADPRRQERDLQLVGRLKDGVTLPQLEAEAAVLAGGLAAASGYASQAARAGVDRVWRVHPRHWHLGVLVLMPIPLLVLAMACVTAASLMLARGSERQREIAIRLAIGAGRSRIVRQLLAESFLLALLATAVAVPVAAWSLQLASSPLDLPITIDPTVLGLTIATAAAATLAFGLAPAVRATARPPSSTLGTVGARSDAVPGQSRMRRLLVAAQVALSLGLLTTGSQLVSTVRSQAVSGGTPAERLLLARFDLQPLGLSGLEQAAFYRDLLAGAERLPDVEAAGTARHAAVWTFGQGLAPASLVVWRSSDAPEKGQIVAGGYAGGGLFGAVGLRTIAGRGFTDADHRAVPQVAVVNETAAKALDGPAVGSVLRVAPQGTAFHSSIEVRIVGIIEPAREPRLDQSGSPAAKVYLPSPIEPEPALALYLRTRGTAAAIAPSVRELAGRIAPRVPILELGSLQDLNERAYAMPLWLARGAAGLGVLGLLLAMAGLYGLSSYVVAMRSREMAIRMALGARPGTILAMVLGQSARLAAAGLVVGGGAAVAVSRLIQFEYHGIDGIDPLAFAGAAALFCATMLVAGAIPAVRASRLDPVEHLKG